MRLQDAKQILKDANIRVCRHYPQLVLTPAQLLIYKQIQVGLSTPKDIAKETGKDLSAIRNTLSVLFKKGFISRIETPLHSAGQQFKYSIVKWVPNAENK